MSALTWFIGGPFLYLCAAIFIVVTAQKVYTFATMPRHIRWDLYPVPHQGSAGSKYQLIDFYKVKPPVNMLGEFIYMFKEILFIRKAFIYNPKIWTGSFPMHMGIYLSAKWLFLLILGIIVEKLTGFPVTPVNGWFWISALYYVTVIVGVLALASGLLGVLILLYLRMTDEGLRDMSDFPAYFNLSLLTAMFGSGFFAWLLADSSFILLRSQLASLFSFSPATPNGFVALELFFMGLFLAYLPFSRMTHYAAKYFFYHSIMWDDEAMKSGSAMEKDVVAKLGLNLSWSAPHIKTNQSWLAQVSPDEKASDNGGAAK